MKRITNLDKAYQTVSRYGKMFISMVSHNSRLLGYKHNNLYYEFELELGEVIAISKFKRKPKAWQILINSKLNTAK